MASQGRAALAALVIFLTNKIESWKKPTPSASHRRPIHGRFPPPVTLASNFAQKNFNALMRAVRNAVASTGHGSVVLAPGAAQELMSRAASALAGGATVAMGATVEPLANGDPSSCALFTTLRYGGNLAEWQLRVRAGYRPTNKAATGNYWLELPRGLIVYGDPLYRPFGWRIRPLPLSEQ